MSRRLIPPHAGLGSGTQLALAVGSAFAALEGLSLTPQDIAARLGRGARSGIGIATFAQGGVVFDGGPRHGALPQLISRLPFPPDWRVLLMFDAETRGLAGANETAAFETLPDFPASETDELYRRIADSALPALARADFDIFCEQVGYLQACMGAYFAPLQGGPYVSPRVSDALEWLRDPGDLWARSELVGTDRLCLCRLGGTRPSLARRLALPQSITRASASPLAQGRNEGATIETSASEIR